MAATKKNANALGIDLKKFNITEKQVKTLSAQLNEVGAAKSTAPQAVYQDYRHPVNTEEASKVFAAVLLAQGFEADFDNLAKQAARKDGSKSCTMVIVQKYKPEAEDGTPMPKARAWHYTTADVLKVMNPDSLPIQPEELGFQRV